MATQIETLRKQLRKSQLDEVRHLGFGYYAAFKRGVEVFKGKYEFVLSKMETRAAESKQRRIEALCFYFGARLLYIARVHAYRYAWRTDAFALRVQQAAKWLASFSWEEQAKLAPRV